jgi:hypothetical protein
MSDQGTTAGPLTVDTALASAARLLHDAKLELTNLQRMERLEKLADTWVNIAGLLMQRERDS